MGRRVLSRRERRRLAEHGPAGRGHARLLGALGALRASHPAVLAVIALAVMLVLASPVVLPAPRACPTPATTRPPRHAQGLRPAGRGLRPRLQRPAAAGRPGRLAGGPGRLGRAGTPCSTEPGVAAVAPFPSRPGAKVAVVRSCPTTHRRTPPPRPHHPPARHGHPGRRAGHHAAGLRGRSHRHLRRLRRRHQRQAAAVHRGDRRASGSCCCWSPSAACSCRLTAAVHEPAGGGRVVRRGGGLLPVGLGRRALGLGCRGPSRPSCR